MVFKRILVKIVRTYSKYSYLLVLTGPLLGYFSLTYKGIWPWALPIYVFVLIPLIEYFSPQNTLNLNHVEEEKALKDPVYDYMLYFCLLYTSDAADE